MATANSLTRDDATPFAAQSEKWWTGPKPVAGQIVQSLPQLHLNRSDRQGLLAYFDNSWLLTEVLFSALRSEEAFVRPPLHGLRHPMIFYYGHPAVLYVNKLRVAGLLETPVDPYLEQLFEVGVDEMSWDDMSKNEMKWPSVATITEYRREVYRLVKNVIETHPALEAGPFLQGHPAWGLAMAFEHERIHLETSSVLMREMPLQFLRRPQHWPARAQSHGPAPVNDFLPRPAAQVTLGKSPEIATFGWDNEYGQRQVAVAAFKATRFTITNGEYYEFVKAGGYRAEKYWSAEGWRWRQFRNTKAPTFWVPEGPGGMHRYKIRHLFELADFESALPVIVNAHEAHAYANWKTEQDAPSFPYRLLTEAEHHSLRPSTSPRSWNFNLGGETRVDAFVDDDGFGDVFGNVWQWCEDDFNALPGFKPHPYYEDFSTPCFDGQHTMIMGGSFMSTGDEASEFARFQFRPHFYQHSGFRLVAPSTAESTAVRLHSSTHTAPGYETDQVLYQYLLLHFGDEAAVGGGHVLPPNTAAFPTRAAQIVLRQAARLGLPMKTALDIGCAVGGSSFELARQYESVVGVDLSASFITAANELKKQGTHPYHRADEGELFTPLTARVPEGIERARVTFRQADACSLPADLAGFDAVLMANLLCRLPSPQSCLARLSGPRGLVAPGGLLVLLSPYSWLGDYTVKESWLGGYLGANGPVHSRETIKGLLQPSFELLEEGDVPLMIREHARKFQYIVSHLMVWQRKG